MKIRTLAGRWVVVGILMSGAMLAILPALAVESYVTEIGRHTLQTTLEWQSKRRAHVTAEMVLPVAPEKVWSVLTDYEHLSEFIPLLNQSRITKRDGQELLLDQTGTIRFPFYKKDLQVVFRVNEEPMTALRFKKISGSFVVYDGSWQLKPVSQGTCVRYEATVEPDLKIPQWVVTQLERGLMKATFRAILQRCSSS